jgi:iron complex outermembrane receptor protein
MSTKIRTAISAVALLTIHATSSAQQLPIEGVTVWAQKRESELQDVPMSVSVLSDADLAVAGLDNISDIAGRLPALSLQSSVSATTTSLRIRRVGNLGNIPTFEPAVGLFVDGVFRSRSLFGTNDMLHVERVEMLSGPQTALYGKNVSGGVLAFYTKRPAEQFDARAELTGGWLDAPGSPSLTQSKLGVAGPLTRTVRAGLAATYSHHGHTLASALAQSADANDDERFASRAQLLWAPSEQLEVRLLAGYAQEDDAQGESDVFLAPGTVSARVAEILRANGWAGVCGDNVPHNRRSCSVAANTLDLKAVDLTLLGNYRLTNGWLLTSITGWDRYKALRSDDDAIQLSAPIVFYRDSEEGRSIQEELRLQSSPGAVSWLAGVLYYRNDYDRGLDGRRPMYGPLGPAAFDPVWTTLLGGIPLALPGQLGLHDSHLDTRYLSVFGSVEWQVTDRFDLTTALRWQREEKKGAINNSVTQPGASFISVVLTPTVTASGAPVNGRLARDSDDMTWSVTPQYRFNDALMSYLTVARGAKSGGFNTGFGNAPLSAREFADERIMHYELGARGTIASERGRFSAAVFRTEYENYQDAAFLSAQFSVGNAGEVELEGAELEGVVQLGERLTLDAAISLADLTYATNTTGMCYPGRAPDGTVPRSCDLSGEHPIDAPVWVTHFGAQYELPVSWGNCYARLDWSWSDRYNTSFSADPRLRQEAYSDVAVRIGVRFGDSYEVVLWGKNLLNEDVTYIDAVLNLFNDASYQSFIAQPRHYGATVRMRF